jgi:UrcA family protein
MKNFSLNNILSAAAFSLVAGFSINASAAEQLDETYIQADPATVQTVRLQYSATELATEEGRIELQHRIARAARKVCGRVERGNLHEASQINQCYKDAQQAAISQIGLDQVAVIGH